MNSIQRAKIKIESIIARSHVPEDPVHAKNTLKWLLALDPDSDEALRIAALGHDIERAIEERKVQRADFHDYDQFKAAHAINSAQILTEILLECGVEDKTLIQQVYDLVCRHEVGGDPRSDQLKDADSISFFNVNVPFYYQRHGWDETKRRCLWGHARLSEKARKVVASLSFDNDELNALLSKIVEDTPGI